MKSALASLLFVGLAVLGVPKTLLHAKTVFVNAATGSDANDGLTEETPFLTIQAAVDAAQTDDIVLVAPGFYDQGGRAESFGNNVLANRVCIEKRLTLRSSHGPAQTLIVGQRGSSDNGLASDAMRCVYATYENTVVEGFTITNGHTTAVEWDTSSQGGGVFLGYGTIVSNCLFTGNSAHSGGASYEGRLLACTVRGNTALEEGGGTFYGNHANCLIVGNSASRGGGSSCSSLAHCTVVGNSATLQGGGTVWGEIVNSIIYYNDAPNTPNWSGYWYMAHSCTYPAPEYEEVVIAAEPQFADTNGWSNLRLTLASLCIDTGSANHTTTTADLDGNPRLAGNAPDMGAFEWQGTGLPIVGFDDEDTEVDEDAGMIEITFFLSIPADGDTTFNLTYGGTAGNGTDYTGAPASVTFADGQTSATTSLTVTDDATPEYPETIVIDLQTDEGYRYAFTRHVVTILDNDGMPAVTRFHLNNGRGGTSERLIEDFDLAVTNDPADYVMSEDPAFSGAQWINHSEEDPFTFTLSEGYGEKTVWFKVRKPDGAGGHLVSLPVSDTIWYGPPLAEAIDQPDAAVDTWGDNGAAWFSIISSGAVGGSLARSSSPMPNDDWAYSSLETTLSIDQPMILSFTTEQVGNGYYEFYLNDAYRQLEDNWAPGPHTYIFELEPGTHTLRWDSNAWPGHHGGGVAGYSTLDDVRLDPLPPRVWFSTENQSAREGEAPQVFVRLEWPLASPLAVTYTLGGTATPGSDFTTSPQNMVTFPAGETNVALTVSVIDDTEPENGETVILTLAPGSGYRIEEPSTHTLNILANDGRIDLLGFWLEGGDTETTNLVVRVDGDASDEPSHVLLSENPDFTGGEWVELSDNILFTLSEGYGTKNVYAKVRIPKTGGGWEESNVLSASIKRVAITLKGALDTHLTVFSPTNAPWFGQTTITHDGEDAAQSAVLPYTYQYASSYMTVTVEGPAKIAFWWKISSNQYYGYTYNGWLSLFVNDQSIRSINGEQDWTYVTHTVPEGTHTLRWQYDQNYYLGGSNCGWVDQLSVTPDWPEATFGSASQSVSENAGQVLLPVQLDRQEAVPITVSYTLGGTAAQGADYTCSPQDSITFAPGETTNHIAISVIDDNLPERSETVILTLSPVEGVLIGTPGQHVLTILPNDGAPVITAFALQGGGSSTTNLAVTLSIAASGGPAEYRLSEDPAFGDAAWLPYSASAAFTLSAGIGAKTLWLEVRTPLDGGGFVVSDPATLILHMQPTLAAALAVEAGQVTSPGASPWFGQIAVSRDGAAAQSGAIPHNGASSLILTLQGQGTVGFWWKVSSELGWDYLYFYADGVYVAAFSGTAGDWAYRTHTFATSGEHTLEWRYTKNGGGTAGSDCGWVDQIDLSGWQFPPVAAPQFSPPDGAFFIDSQQVTLACATPNAEIRYTLDGGEPTVASALYTVPFTVNATTTVKAKAFKPNYPDSDTVQATYVKSLAAPHFSPPSGTVFTQSIQVAITSAVPTAAIHYTLDGSDPTDGSTLYTAPVTLTGTTTIKARAYNGKTPASGITSATYTLQPAEAPTFDPASGFLFDTSRDVTLSCITQDAVIRYTLDGSDPTDESALYATPLTCTAPMTVIRARAFKTGMAPSAAATATYFRRGSVYGWGYNGHGQLSIPSQATNVAALASGAHHVIALLSDRTLTAWGNNWYGQCTPPAGLSDTVAIASRGYHTLALRADGSVAAWGNNDNGQCNVPATLSDAVALASGDYHTVALRADGTVAAWGHNSYGQCNPPADLSNAVAIAVGDYHSVALRADGTVIVWGDNGYGQRTVPAGLAETVAISAGSYHSAALRLDGTVTAWGYNGYGQCTPPESLAQVADISSGAYHTLARFDDLTPVSATPPSGYQIPPGSGTAITVCLSAATHGGTVRYTLDGSEPTDTSEAYTGVLEFATAATLKARLFREGQPVGATLTATYAKRAAPPVATPAPNAQFIPQGGTLTVTLSAHENEAVIRYTLDGSEPTDASETYTSPLQLAGRTTLKARTFKDGLIPSATATALYTLSGDLYGWGANSSGQCDVPATLSNAVAVAAGISHTLALRPDGSVAAWGYNGYSQCNVPATLSNAVAVAAGQYHSAALRADGSVAVWGDNGYGQHNTPAGLTDAVALSARGNHTVALRTDGSVAAWGYNGNGECTVPLNATNALAVAAGGNHSLALLSDGTVTAWGYNGSGQRAVPAGLSNVVAIAAGWDHSVALLSDGSLAAWGQNSYGQCTIPPGLSGVIAIAAGNQHTVALRADGSIVLWGRNTDGQSVLPGQLPSVAAVTAGGSHTFVRFNPATTLAFTPPAGYWIPPASASLAVAIASTDPQGGIIRHTLDGSDPTDASEAYTGPLALAVQTTVRARLFRDGTPAGAPVSATYFKRLATPVFSPASGTQVIPQDGTLTVTLSCTDPDVAIRYTLDGSEPAETSGIYTAPLALGQTATVKARAFKPGFIPSASSAAIYARNGDLGAWGQNNYGQGTIPQNLTNATQVTAGSHNSAVLRASGTVTVWGYNGYSVNTPPADLTNVVAVAFSTYHGLALRASGTATAWGYNSNGQCSVPEGLLDVLAIAVGTYNSAAVKSDGTVNVWGYSGYGVNTPPADLTNALALALGPYHILALRVDGTVTAWGDNGSGRCNVPAALSNAVAVAAGEYHSVALTAEGRVVAWGYNGDGQCDVPAGLENVIAIAAGNRHTVALRADGTLAAWGDNNQGQILVPSGLPPVAAIAAAGDFTLVQYGTPAPVAFTPPTGMMVPGSGYPFPVHVRGATLGGTLRYTLDGTAPGNDSDAYTAPAMLGDATTVRAALFLDGQRVGAESAAHYPLLPGGIVFHTVSTTVTPAEAGTASGGGVIRKNAATTVTATVTNTTRYAFARWLRNGSPVSTLPVYTFTVTGNSVMTAVFDLRTFPVTVAIEPSNLGWINGTGWWSYGVTNTLTAYPYSGCRFLGWEDALTGEPLGSGTTYSLAVTNAFTVKARFEELVTSHTITTRTEPEGLASISGAGVYPNGQLATFTAPQAITNDPVRYVFQHFKRNGSWATTANPWNWWMSRTDAATIDVAAVYIAQPLSPKVRQVSSNLGTPVPATDNLQVSVVFDRPMNPAYPPDVTVSNLTAGGAARILPATNNWTSWYTAGDTYRCPPLGFVRGDDGDYVLSVANARDTYDGILLATNAWTFRVDATPPPVPTLRLTASNDTWFTVGWADYTPPADLNGFRIYVSEVSFTNLATLSPVSYYWSGARSFTRYGIQLDTSYWIAAVPVDQAGNMETYVTPLQVRIPRAVPPPVTLTVTAPAADTAFLNWTGYAGNSFGFSGFYVYQSATPFDSVTNMTPVATLAKNVRTYTASGLDRTLTHWFAVVGFNSRDEMIPEVVAKSWSDPYQGAITQNTTLGANGTVTEILGTLTVSDGANLTIPAGATLAFRPGTGIVIENGRITANGTALRPILMTATNLTGAAPQAGDWTGITLGAQAGASVLRHVRLEFGQGLTVAGSTPTIDACTAFYNRPAAFRAQSGATIRTKDALLLYNATALLAESDATIDVSRSIIRNNQTNAVAMSGSNLVATNVWWGTAELQGIQDTHAGTVTSLPFLIAEPVLTPAADAADGNRNVGIQSVNLALAGRVADAVQISEDSLFTGSFFDAFEPRKTVALSDGGGSKTLYVRFRNAAGQISDTVTLPINYITGGPQITGCNIAEGAVLTRPFIFTASAYSGLGVATLRVLVDDAVALTTNAASLNTRWDIRDLAPGTHRIRVQAFDTVGNLGTRAFNVTANIQPPPNPVLNAPANNLLTTDDAVNVSGTAEPFETVALRRNGAVIQNVAAAANGAFSAVMPLVEGENVLIATVTDAYGTGRSNERRVTRDSGAPEPVALLIPTYTQGTGLKFGWRLPAEGESPSSIALLRSEEPFATAAEATWQSPWTTDNPLVAAPPVDGRWYFAAIGRDAANNQSVLSNVITNDYDGTAPTFTLAYDKPSPCGTGLLRLEVESSEPLTGLPTITVQPPAASGPTMLTVSNTAPNRYICTYNVQSLAGSGLLSVKVSGSDFAGNRATAVTPSGTPMTLDTRAPVGTLDASPSGLIQVTNPVPMLVTLRLDEIPATPPTLRFVPPEGATLPISLTGGGTNWSGQLELLPSMGSGAAHFTLTVSDILGNTGSQLGGITEVELYNTAQPVPPARVIDLRASTDQPEGVIKLAWLPVSDAETYTLYRQAGAAGGIPDELVAEDITDAIYSDTPPEDGFYRYVVCSVRRGSAAVPSPQATGLSDRTPPPAPQDLSAALSSSGVRVEWSYPTEGEQPEYFRVYRNGTLLRNRVSAAARFILDNPASGAWEYSVASVDRCGNEAQSNSSSINMTLPAIVRTDVTVGTDRIPRITWQTRAEHVGVNLYRNGVKLNTVPLTGSTYTDTSLSGSSVTQYEVRGVNANGDESAGRQLPVFHLAYALSVNPDTGGTALLRYFDQCVLSISNRTANAAFGVSQLTLTRTIGGVSLAKTVQTQQSAAIGGMTALGVIYPCATALGAQNFAATVTQTLDDPSASVRYEAAFLGTTPSLAASQLDITLDTQPVAGAACTPQARFYNRSEVPIDIVMWRNGQSGDVAIRVLDKNETEVNRVDVMMPKASLIPTPDSTRGFIRIQPKSSTLLSLPEIIVPEALGEDATAFIEVRADIIYNACGQADEAISGPLQGRLAITPRPTAYTAFGLPEQSVYRAGETMVITGHAFDRVTGTPTTNAAVNVGIALDGYAWFIEAQSDELGRFRAEWPILPGISGLSQIWASHPQVKDRLNHGQAAIYQAYFRPQEGSLRMAANDELTVRLNAYNPGSFTFTNMTSAFTAWKVSNGVTNMLPMSVVSGAVVQVQTLALPPRQLVPVRLTLVATEDALPSFFCRFEMVTPEGLRIPFDAHVTVTAPLPLLTIASPSAGYVDMSLDRGKVRSTDVEVRNDGMKPLLGGQMTAPAVPWMQVALTKNAEGTFTLPDLAPGQSFTFQVIYAPDDSVEMKYYSAALSITGTNTVTVKTLNLYAKVTSELRGAVAFHVNNSLEQVVPDASIRVRSALDGTERTGFKTDANGDIEITGLMEGRWHWQVSASGHATQAGTVEIEADVAKDVDVTLNRELVTVTFTVVPVPFTDRYEIKIEQTFSTYVPAPVLVVDPIYQDLGTVDGPFEHSFTATAKNYGLIKLTEFTVQGSQQPNASIIPAISYLPELAPMQQIQIPYTITFLGDGTQEQEPQSLYTPLTLSPESGTASSRNIRPLSEAPPQFDPCNDDFMESVQKLMSYLNGRYGSMSGTQLANAQAALGALWNYASGKGRGGISVGDMLNMYQKLMCLGDLLGSSSKGQKSSGGSSGGGGSGYGGAGGGCFTAGTPVLMADGTVRPIEEIKPGDTVRTGPRKDDVARVTETYTRAADSILALTLANGTTLRTTAEHRIWVDARGWALAKDIQPGDRVASTNDTTVQVTAKATGKPETVYTFELREDIAFYAHGVLVRHLCGMQFPNMTPTHGTPSRTKGGAQ